MARRHTVRFFILAWLLCGCGPKASGGHPALPSSGAEEPSASASEGGDASAGAQPVSQHTVESDEPNVPFAMEGGGPRHLHRATVPGPKTLPSETGRFQCGGRIAAAPVIGPDGTVYVGSIDGTFNALSRSGRLRWSYICDEPIFSTAAVSQTGKIFVGCDDDSLLAFSTDGTLRFVFKTQQDMDSSPVIGENGTIYVGGEKLHALDSDGHPVFKLWLGAHITASPSIRPDGVIAVGSHDHRFYLVSKDGTVLSAFDTKGAIQGPAAALQGNDVVFGSDDQTLYRLAEKGALRWKRALDGAIRGGIAVNESEDTFFTATMAGTVYAVDAKKGTVRWQTALAGPVRAAPMLDSEGVLFVGSRDKSLYALEAATGRILWRMPLDAEVDASPAVAFGRKLTAVADDGTVRFLEEKQ